MQYKLVRFVHYHRLRESYHLLWAHYRRPYVRYQRSSRTYQRIVPLGLGNFRRIKVLALYLEVKVQQREQLR